MNDILTEDAKSFKIIRPRLNKGEQKPQITYTRQLAGTLYLNLATTTEELYNGMRYLFGPKGAQKSFKRVYYPKRFIWKSTLYNQPRVINVVDDKAKVQDLRKNFPEFNGMIKNKLLDKKNCILDFTDIFTLVIPNDEKVMIRSTVMDYVEKIYPELMCYVLFHNPKHNKANDVDDDPVSQEMLQSFVPDELAKEFEELSDEQWSYLKTAITNNIEASLEAFSEKLFAESKVFSMGGPAIGLSQYGFDKFIISIPYTLKANSFLSLQYIQSRIPIQRNIKKNPTLIYQLSLIQFMYKVFEAYSNGTGGNEFVNEIIKHNVTFHVYSETGVGFVFNLKELRQMRYNTTRFARMLQNRLQLLTMCNTGVLKNSDLDEIDKDDVAEEIDGYFKKTTDILDEEHTSIARTNLKSALKTIIKKDTILKTIMNSKKTTDEEIITDPEQVSSHHIMGLSHSINLKQKDIIAAKAAADTMTEIEKRFSNSKSTIVSDDKEEAGDITLTDEDFDDILNANDGETEEVTDELTDSRNIVEESNNETGYSSDFEEGVDPEDVEFMNEDHTGFSDEYTILEETSEEQPPEEEEPEYIEIKPKRGGKGPIKLEQIKEETIYRTPAEQKRIANLKEKYKSVELDGKKIEDIIGNSSKIDIIHSADQIKNKPKTKDPGALNANLMDFQRAYIENNYQSDIINAVRSLSMNKADPLYIVNADVEDSSDQFNDKYTYTFVLEDENKKKHTLKFDVPKLNESGMVRMNGNDQYLKKQLIRKPIVKIGPDKVYVTTQLNSFQVMRKGLLLNKGSEVIRKLFSVYYEEHPNPNVVIERGNCEEDNKSYLTTLEYDTLAKNYFFVKLNSEKAKFGEHVEIFFSQKAIRERIEKHNIRTGYENNEIPNNILPVAINYTSRTMISIDMNRNSSVNSTIIALLNEHIKDDGLLDYVKTVKAPKRRLCTKLEIQSFSVPLIAFLNYLFGWQRVSSYFPENEIEFSEKLIKNTNKMSIKFYDGYLYYNQYPIQGALFLNGLTEIDTENYNYADLDNKAMYINYTYEKFKTRNVIKGWITAKENMLDLKTLQILEALKLPTDFLEIFLYCNDLLADNQVAAESDVSNYRVRSNEIISECLYKVINDYYMVYKKKTGKSLRMSIPREAVMAKVYNTEILEMYDAINPVSELRELGLTTFKGPGGTKIDRAFTMGKRAFDPSYYGIFGMSTPDNYSAGVTKELSMNTCIENTLGFVGSVDRNNRSITNIAPVTEALSPYVTEVDDPSRIAFTSIQTKHVGGMLGASLPCVRTGVEKGIHYQTSEKFSRLAKADGVVTNIDEIQKKIYITYTDGTKETIDYKEQMLKNSDAFNQSVYQCVVKVGQKVKKMDPIVVDARFFKIDPITKDVVCTQSINALAAIIEGTYTEDDSSLLCETFADKMGMDFTKRKQISIGAMDTIIDYKKVGDPVQLGDPIFVFDQSGTFEEEQDDADDSLYKLLLDNLDTKSLAQMIHQTPKSPLTGTIADMKVYWTIPIQKMSKSVAKFVNEYINKIKKEITDEEKFTGKPSNKRRLIEMTKVSPGRDRINGCQVEKDGGIVIEYFISTPDTMSVGDKCTLNSALKTVVSTVVEKGLEPYTSEGKRLDGLFSIVSINARMISSIWYTGWLGKILYDSSKRYAKEFLEEIGEKLPENDRKVIVKE